MTKAILVLDMPECCKDCDCYFNNGNSVFCCITRTDIEDSLLTNDDCPLKPMPEKYDDEATNENIEIYHRGFMEGYNDCIDEIEGKEEC